MLSKRLRKRIGKNCLIWTLITAVFVAAYSMGLYMIYKANTYDDIHNTKGSAMHYTTLIRLYERYNYVRMLNIAIEDLIDCNYFYYGKIEDDGSLTDIYKTDYDLFVLNADNGIFGERYSDVDVIEYCLTDDAEKQGKVERSSYTTKHDNPMTECFERHYLTCPEDVFNKIKDAQNNGKYLAREWVFWDLDYADHFEDSVFSDDDMFNTVYRKAISFVTRCLTHNIEDAVSDFEFRPNTIKDYDRAFINRADVDIKAGKILSGELMINGDSYFFPDDNQNDTAFIVKRYLEKYFFKGFEQIDSDTIVSVSLHKRPDSILEKNKDLLRDNFDKSYLESLKYEDGLVAGYGNIGPQAGLEGITYDYKQEDGQIVVSGICKYDDGYFRYVCIMPYAGFFEAFAPCILEVMLKVWIPGLIVISLLTAAVCRKRY